MSNTASKITPSLLGIIFWLFTRLVCWLLLGCLSCIAMAVIIVILHGQYAGLNSLQNAFVNQLQYVTLIGKAGAVNTIYHWLSFIHNQLSLPHVAIPLMSKKTEKIIALKLWPYIQAVYIGTKLLLVRLYCLLRWLELFLVLGSVGLIDGLTQRTIRRASAGRESALIYHQSKSLVLFSLIVGIFFSLLLPIATKQIALFVVMAALLFGLAMQITAKRFKKYL